MVVCQAERKELLRRLEESRFGENDALFSAYFTRDAQQQPVCRNCLLPVAAHPEQQVSTGASRNELGRPLLDLPEARERAERTPFSGYQVPSSLSNWPAQGLPIGYTPPPTSGGFLQQPPLAPCLTL